MWLVEHHKGTRREGWQTILRLVVTCIALTLILNVFFPFLWRDNPGAVMFFYGVLAFVGIVALAHAYCNIAEDGEFRCRLSAEQL